MVFSNTDPIQTNYTAPAVHRMNILLYEANFESLA